MINRVLLYALLLVSLLGAYQWWRASVAEVDVAVLSANNSALSLAVETQRAVAAEKDERHRAALGIVQRRADEREAAASELAARVAQLEELQSEDGCLDRPLPDGAVSVLK